MSISCRPGLCVSKNNKCTPSTNNYVQERLRQKPLQYLRTFGIGIKIRRSCKNECTTVQHFHRSQAGNITRVFENTHPSFHCKGVSLLEGEKDQIEGDGLETEQRTIN